MGKYNKYRKDSTIKKKVLGDLGLGDLTDEQIQYAFGGMLKKGISLGEDYGKSMADIGGGMVGYKPFQGSEINDPTMRKIAGVGSTLTRIGAPIAATVAGGPAAGAALSGLQTQVGIATNKPEEPAQLNQHEYVQSGQEFMEDGGGFYKEGGNIHIKKSHEGRFTEYKKRTGKTTQEALHSKDPHVRAMAQFAVNSKKWHHSDGGSFTNEGFNELPIQGALGTQLADGSTNPYRRDNMYAQGGQMEQQGVQYQQSQDFQQPQDQPQVHQPSQQKAAQMLKDGHVNGKPLTPSQRRLFGMIASGKARYDSGGKLENSNAMMAMVDQELMKFDNGGNMVGQIAQQGNNVPLGDTKAYNQALAQQQNQDQQMVNNSPLVNTSTKGTLTEYYKSKGKSVPSVMERKALAKALGIQRYDASAEKNTELLERLKNIDRADKINALRAEDEVKANQQDQQQGQTQGPLPPVQQPYADGGSIYKGSASRTPQELAQLQAQLHTVFDNSTPDTQLQQMYRGGGVIGGRVSKVVGSTINQGQSGMGYRNPDQTALAIASMKQLGYWNKDLVTSTHNKYAEGGELKPDGSALLNQLQTEQLPNANQGLNKKLIKSGDGVDVYSVDGNYVRNKYNPDFVVGGHHYVGKNYEMIPKNEVWIDNAYADHADNDPSIKTARDAAIIHELNERKEMTEQGKSYNKAHIDSNKVEQKFEDREGYACGGKMKRKLGGRMEYHDGGLTNYNGAKHEQGGINIPDSNNQVEGGEVGIPAGMSGQGSTYVASDNLKIDKATAKQFNLPDKYIGETPAKVLSDAKKKTDFRPNEPVDQGYIKDLSKTITQVNDTLKENKFMKLMMKLRQTDPQKFSQLMQGIQQRAQGGQQSSQEGSQQDNQQDASQSTQQGMSGNPAGQMGGQQQGIPQGQQQTQQGNYSNQPAMSLPNQQEMVQPQQPVEQHRMGGRIQYTDGDLLSKYGIPKAQQLSSTTYPNGTGYNTNRRIPYGNSSVGNLPQYTQLQQEQQGQLAQIPTLDQQLVSNSKQMLDQSRKDMMNLQLEPDNYTQPDQQGFNMDKPVVLTSGQTNLWKGNSLDGSNNTPINVGGNTTYPVGQYSTDPSQVGKTIYPSQYDAGTENMSRLESPYSGNTLTPRDDQKSQFGIGTDQNPLIGTPSKQPDKSTTTGTQFNGSDILNTIGLGNAFDLTRSALSATNRVPNRFGRIYTNQVNLGKLDPTQQLMNLRENTANAQNNMRQSGANMSQYLANRTGLYNQQAEGEGNIYANTANQNVQLRNQQATTNASMNNQANAQNQNVYQQEQIANAQDKSQIRNTAQGALASTQGRMDVERRDKTATDMQKMLIDNGWLRTNNYGAGIQDPKTGQMKYIETFTNNGIIAGLDPESGMYIVKQGDSKTQYMTHDQLIQIGKLASGKGNIASYFVPVTTKQQTNTLGG